MRLRNIPKAKDIIENSHYVIQNPETMKGSFQKVFSNQNPIHIEIGMGKGRFLIELAKKNPKINYIGIEMYSSVLLRAVQKIETEDILNIRFLQIDARTITDIFGKEEIDKIYLNFSDPWPKDRHAKRRLPSKEFLERYNVILKKEGFLEFKTDNRGLFNFAVEQAEIVKWNICGITYDLHHDEIMNRGNIMTEYEEKFSEKGNPIFKYIICR